MKIVEENPPHNIRELCERKFDLSNIRPVWTFGDTIFNPHKGIIDGGLYAHETTHYHQQGEDPEKWWIAYMQSDKFRFEQELQAYRVQYGVYKQLIKDRNELARKLYSISVDLSSPLYGQLCTYSEARKLVVS